MLLHSFTWMILQSLAKLAVMKHAHYAPHVLALILTAGAVVCTPALASGQWKWRDANGSSQYSDRPPPQGTPDSAILAKPRASTARIVTQPVQAASAPAAGSRATPPAAKASENELDATTAFAFHAPTPRASGKFWTTRAVPMKCGARKTPSRPTASKPGSGFSPIRPRWTGPFFCLWRRP